MAERIEEMHTVIMIWAKSHAGVVVNEAADVLAEQMYEGEAEKTGAASMAHCGVKFTNMRGVRARMQGIVRARLRETMVESQYVKGWIGRNLSGC